MHRHLVAHFLGGWTALLLVSLALMGRRWTLLLLLFPPVLGELWLGNLNILLGLAIVVGMRYPASVVVHPADEDHAGRRPHLVRRAARVAVARHRPRRHRGRRRGSATSCAVAVVRLHRGVEDAGRRDGQRPAPGGARRAAARLVVAALLVFWAARTDRAWIVPIAAGLAVPFLWWNAFAVMVAAVPLYAWRPPARRTAPTPGAPVPVPAQTG